MRVRECPLRLNGLIAAEIASPPRPHSPLRLTPWIWLTVKFWPLTDSTGGFLVRSTELTTPLICDGRIVGQALANVLKNAGEAIAARRAAAPDSPPGRTVISLTAADDRLDIEVEDNGVGLPQLNRDRLTEPYVTTREKGTGLGLAIVKRILEEHGGGLILADASPGPGARVVLWFRRNRDSLPAREADSVGSKVQA